jgi:hypothetical protein
MSQADLVILTIKLDGFPDVIQLVSKEEADAEIRAVECLVRCEMVVLIGYSICELLQEVV